jgi:hypothetical protein
MKSRSARSYHRKVMRYGRWQASPYAITLEQWKRQGEPRAERMAKPEKPQGRAKE